MLYQLSYGPKCARVPRTPDASVPVPQRLLSNARARAPGAEVTLLLAQALANGEIAKRLGGSSDTVLHHAEWVFTKLEVHSRRRSH